MLELGQDGDWCIFKESRKGPSDWSRKRERDCMKVETGPTSHQAFWAIGRTFNLREIGALN